MLHQIISFLYYQFMLKEILIILILIILELYLIIIYNLKIIENFLIIFTIMSMMLVDDMVLFSLEMK